jgi:hypothetical protein
MILLVCGASFSLAGMLRKGDRAATSLGPFLKLNLPTTLQGRKALRPYEAVISLQEIALVVIKN